MAPPYARVRHGVRLPKGPFEQLVDAVGGHAVVASIVPVWSVVPGAGVREAGFRTALC